LVCRSRKLMNGAMLRRFTRFPHLQQKRCFAAATRLVSPTLRSNAREVAKLPGLAVGDNVSYKDPKAVFHNYIFNHKDFRDKETYAQNVQQWVRENQVGNVVEIDEKTGAVKVDFGYSGTYIQGTVDCPPDMLHKNVTSLYNLKLRTSDGNAFDIAQTKGKVVVCTNIEDAQCVRDIEWKKMASLYRRFKSRKESDQVIFLLFPNFKFDKSEEWVSQKMGMKLGEGFHLMQWGDVNGKNLQPAYNFLTNLHQGTKGRSRVDWKQQDVYSETIVWSSTQFVVGRNGLVAKRLIPGAFKNLWLACEGELVKEA